VRATLVTEKRNKHTRRAKEKNRTNRDRISILDCRNTVIPHFCLVPTTRQDRNGDRRPRFDSLPGSLDSATRVADSGSRDIVDIPHKIVTFIYYWLSINFMCLYIYLLSVIKNYYDFFAFSRSF